MAIAKLSIDLEARLAGLQQSLDKAGALAEKESARMSRAFEGARAAVLSVSGALGGLFTVGAAAAFVRQTGEAAEAITNLSRVAGTSTEDFQRYAFAARTVGIEQDKLSDILKDVQDKVGDFLQTGGGPLADFFEKIAPQVGVTAEQFRRLGGADALQLYVSSLERANLSQSELTFYLEAIASDATLLLPLLRDNGRAMGELGDRAERLGVVLDDKAIAAAREFNQNLRELETNATAAARVIAGPLIEALNDVFTRIKAAQNTFDSFSEFIRLGFSAEAFTDASDGFSFYTKRVAELRVELERLKASGGLLDSLQISGAQRELADAEKLVAFYREALRLNPGVLPQASYSNEGRNAMRPGGVVVRPPGGGGGGGRGGGAGAAAAGAGRNAIADAEEGFNELFERYWRRNQEALDRADEAAARDAQSVREEIERAARASYEATRTPLERLNIELARQQELLDALGPAYFDTYERATNAAQDAFEEATKVNKAVKDADNFARELGLTFESAFENAIVEGENLRKVIDSLGDDILRLVTRELVTKPFADELTKLIRGSMGGGSGGGLGGILSGLFGGFFADGGFLPPGRWGIAGERGPEPIFGGRTGLTVQPNGGGMRVVNHFVLSGPVDRRTQEQIATSVGLSVQRAIGRNG